MSRELKRLQEVDRRYGLNFAPYAENLEKIFTNDLKESRALEQEINGGSCIRADCHMRKSTPIGKIKGSGGLYVRFGNNTVQEQINNAHLLYVTK